MITGTWQGMRKINGTRTAIVKTETGTVKLPLGNSTAARFAVGSQVTVEVMNGEATRIDYA